MAAKGKENRILVTLACTECKERNYITPKNKKNDPERLELRKYCPRCRRIECTVRRSRRVSRRGRSCAPPTHRPSLAPHSESLGAHLG